jgi:hypothetical protein
MGKDLISILMVCDGNNDYLSMAERSICSAANNLENPYRLEVNMVGVGLSEEQRERFVKLSQRRRFELRLFDFDMGRVSGFLPDGHGNITWVKFFAPELLPDRDKCIFMDADTCVVRNIAELWNEDVSGCFFAAVNHVLLINRHTPVSGINFNATKIEESKGLLVIDDGIVVFNLEEIRKDDRFKRIGISLASGALLKDVIKGRAAELIAEKFLDAIKPFLEFDLPPSFAHFPVFGVEPEWIGSHLRLASFLSKDPSPTEVAATWEHLETIESGKEIKISKSLYETALAQFGDRSPDDGDIAAWKMIMADKYKNENDMIAGFWGFVRSDKDAKEALLTERIYEKMILSDKDERWIRENFLSTKIIALESVLKRIALETKKMRILPFKYNAMVSVLCSTYEVKIENVVRYQLQNFVKNTEYFYRFLDYLVMSKQMEESDFKGTTNEIFAILVDQMINKNKRFSLTSINGVYEKPQFASKFFQLVQRYPLLKLANDTVKYYYGEKPVILHDSAGKKAFARLDEKAVREMGEKAFRLFELWQLSCRNH